MQAPRKIGKRPRSRNRKISGNPMPAMQPSIGSTAGESVNSKDTAGVSPLKTGYSGFLNGEEYIKGVSLETAVAWRQVDPYNRRIKWISSSN